MRFLKWDLKQCPDLCAKVDSGFRDQSLPSFAKLNSSLHYWQHLILENSKTQTCSNWVRGQRPKGQIQSDLYSLWCEKSQTCQTLLSLHRSDLWWRATRSSVKLLQPFSKTHRRRVTLFNTTNAPQMQLN